MSRDCQENNIKPANKDRSSSAVTLTQIELRPLGNMDFLFMDLDLRMLAVDCQLNSEMCRAEART